LTTLAGHSGAEPLQLAARVSLLFSHFGGEHTTPALPGVNVHPVAGEQPSMVHSLSSSQTAGGPLSHAPARQMSPVVHAS
jgi:hypothetical protein